MCRPLLITLIVTILLGSPVLFAQDSPPGQQNADWEIFFHIVQKDSFESQLPDDTQQTVSGLAELTIMRMADSAANDITISLLPGEDVMMGVNGHLQAGSLSGGAAAVLRTELFLAADRTEFPVLIRWKNATGEILSTTVSAMNIDPTITGGAE